MIRTPSFLQALRQERGPLAVLVMLAVMIRASVLMVGVMASPAHALDGLGQLCEPSAHEESQLPVTPHNQVECSCTLSCAHSALQGAAGLLVEISFALTGVPANAGAIGKNGVSLSKPSAYLNGPIRAPPFV